MSTCPPPNEAIAELAAVLGPDNVRTLIRTYLRDFPISFDKLSTGERSDRFRLVHSMKSNSRLMGALELSRRMGELEARLADNDGAEITAAELAEMSQLYAAIAQPLRAFLEQ